MLSFIVYSISIYFQADNRFAHVTSDPRFKPVKEEECYIEENDERWPLLIQVKLSNV